MCLRMPKSESQNSSTSCSSLCKRCSARRKAVFFPIPGKVEKEATAFSNNFDDIFKFYNLKI